MSALIPLSDARLTQALARRAAGPHTASELVRDVQAAVEEVPQRSRWVWPATVRRLLLPALLLVAVLPALVGFLLAGRATDSTPPSTRGEIAFVQATYLCDPGPCRIQVWSGRVEGLQAVGSRIVRTAADGVAPMPVVDVPGTLDRVAGSMPTDPRSDRLAGPDVAWSPDGSRLAFRTFNDAPGIYIVNRDGSDLTRLVDLKQDRDTGMGTPPSLAWSPDGAHIAYIYPYAGRYQPLWVVDVADGVTRQLDDRATRVVAWSPDGSRIAFARSYRNVDLTKLVVIEADGTDATVLEAADRRGYHITALAWSPDGSHIAFERRTDGESVGPSFEGLWLIAADGTMLRRLGPEPPPLRRGAGCCVLMAGGGTVKWSPDGRRIGRIAHDQERGSVIVVIEADGAEEHVLAPADTFDWSPDGSRIVLADGPRRIDDASVGEVTSTEDWSSITIVDVNGSDARSLGPGEFPDWSP